MQKINKLIINLSDNVNIDNNVFGYIFDGIKIYSIDNCGIDFISNKTNEAIKQYDILPQNEELELLLKEEEYEPLSCKISFSLIITEPEYEEYNEYPSFILKENNANEKANFIRNKYEGKIGYLNILINQGIIKNCGNNCSLCLKNTNISNCILCKNGFNVNNEKICQEIIQISKVEEEIPTTYIKEVIDNYINNDTINNTILINGCKMEDIIKGICRTKELSNENFQIIYSYIKNDILGKNYNKENLIIETAEVIFQLSTLEQQKDSSSYISSVDLKKCEKILKDEYKIKDEDN